jgi:protein subunit release factor A
MSIIPDCDLKIEVIYKETGTTERPGGQHAGGPYLDVRATHIPTGIFAQVGYARSQHRNKEVAIEMIEAALTSQKLK